MSAQTIPDLSQEDAFAFLVTYLREGRQDKSQYANYGYDLCLSNVISDFLSSNHYKLDQYDKTTTPMSATNEIFGQSQDVYTVTQRSIN
jgi:hypothetical protein